MDGIGGMNERCGDRSGDECEKLSESRFAGFKDLLDGILSILSFSKSGFRPRFILPQAKSNLRNPSILPACGKTIICDKKILAIQNRE